MGALFTGADVAQKMFDDNFTMLEKTKIGVAAGAIATGELHVKTTDMVRSALPAWLRGDALRARLAGLPEGTPVYPSTIRSLAADVLTPH